MKKKVADIMLECEGGTIFQDGDKYIVEWDYGLDEFRQTALVREYDTLQEAIASAPEGTVRMVGKEKEWLNTILAGRLNGIRPDPETLRNWFSDLPEDPH